MLKVQDKYISYLNKVLEKIDKQPLKVKNIFKGVFQGIVSGDNKAFYLSNCYEKDNFIFDIMCFSLFR